MLIIPAIDIKNGKCVRLHQGEMDKVKIYSSHPADIAQEFEKYGAEIIHIVDLDGAAEGKVVNLKAISQIIKAIKIPVQLGGGIRNKETIDEVLNLGIKRVILGTSIIIRNDVFLRCLFEEYGEKIICGIDAREGKVAISGWKEITEIEATNLSQKLEKLGAKRIIYTDIKRDGMLSGPNYEEISNIANTVKIPVIASGGVSSEEDIKELKKIGVEGVIIGKAIYENKVKIQSLWSSI